MKLKNKMITDKKRAIILFFLTLCAGFASAQTAPQLGKDDLKKVIAAMTREEKVNLVKGVGMSFSGATTAPVAGSILGRVPGSAGATFAIPRLGIPAMVLADGPAGLRIDSVRKGDSKRYYATAFPTGTSLASTWDTELIMKVGHAMGEEVKEYGVDILLAPGLNIQRNPLGGRNFEYYAEDPLLSGTFAAAMVNGIQSNGVGASIKHFAVNNQETSRSRIDARVSQRALREIYLKGFEIAVKTSFPWTVMSAYNKINGTFASENVELLTGILKNEWGFKGLVMTDWFAGHDYVSQVKAGNDLLMPGRKPEGTQILEALEAKTLREEVLDANIERILIVILKSPSFKKYAYSNRPRLTEHEALTRAAGSAGIVLLKNSSATLPLVKNNIALFGNTSYDMFAGGTGSGEVNKRYTVTMDEGLKNAGFGINESLKARYLNYIRQGKASMPKRTNLLQAIKPLQEYQLPEHTLDSLAATSSVAVLTLGRNAGEGNDRLPETDFYLSAQEKSLLRKIADKFHAKGKKLIVVLNVDAPVDLVEWRDAADAILLAWLPGMEAGNSIADVISGKVNPSGKLAITFPVKYEDEPSAQTFPRGGTQRPDSAEYREGIYVGYRFFNSFGIKPAYPFGYGLSYSNFKYSDLKLAQKTFNGKMTVTVMITNTGKHTGREVVQLYLTAPSKMLNKPKIELKGFAKTKPIRPGGSQKVNFSLDARDLASFDEGRSSWIAEEGTYSLKIAASSEDIRQTASFVLPGEIMVEQVNNLLAPKVIVEWFKSPVHEPLP